MDLGASCKKKMRLGGVLDRLGGFLERLRGVLEASWGRLGASWEPLGASWRRLGGVLGRFLALPVASRGAPGTILEHLSEENAAKLAEN